jgi:hypothetical protein
MKITLSKFGSTLVSRPSGKEAWLAFQPTIKDVPENEEIIVDFENVIVLTPSWTDEFLRPLKSKYPNVTLINTKNASVQATLAILAKEQSI